MPTRTRFFALLMTLAALACIGVLPVRAADRTIVFAAASLKNALDEVAQAWKSETGSEVAISYAASSALARQIEQGAPADIFIAADLDWMAYLSERQFTRPDTEVELLGNRLVLIAPKDSDVEAEIAPGLDLAALLGDGRLALGDVSAVPAGKYARAALENLGIWADIEDRLAQAENVRAALKFVSTGEAPLGIVYQTDAAADPDVRIVATFPADSHPPIVYPAALTAEGDSPIAADFLVYLRGSKAKGIFEAQGFSVLAPLATSN